MPRNRAKTIGGRSYRYYNSIYLENAVREVKNRKLSVRQASEKYAVPKSSIHDRLKGIHRKKVGRPSALGDANEAILSAGLIKCAQWGFPLTPTDVRELVQNYLNNIEKVEPFFRGTSNKPGPEWMRSFLARHADLSVRFGENIKRVRAAVSSQAIAQYFDNLKSSLIDVPVENILNYDETNFSDDPGKVKVVVKRGSRHPERVIDHSKTSTSVMISGTAAGELLPPYVLYKAKNLYPGWVEGGVKDSCYNRNESGWFDINTFEDWFVKICLPFLRKKEGKKLIIGDNLTSHVSLKVIQICEANNINFVLLPPNCTHLAQPLDVAFFRPLKTIWRQKLDSWKKQNKGVLPKSEFPKLLKATIDEMGGNTCENLVAGFKATGIVPFDPSQVLKKLPDYIPPQQSQPVSSAWSDAFVDILKNARLGSEKSKTPKGKKIQVKPGESVKVSDFQTVNEIQDNDENMVSSESADAGESSKAAYHEDKEKEVEMEEHLKEGDFVIVKYESNKHEELLFVGLILKINGDDYEIRFLRKKIGVKQIVFIFPDVPDEAEVSREQILRKIKTSSVKRGRYIFSNVDCDKMR